MAPVPASFFAREADAVAPEVLGCLLVSTSRGGRTLGRIVEVEAYLGERDPAAHCYGGRRTERTEPMYGPPGTAYVYFTYGMHWCFNIVTGRTGVASAVLVRAVEPLDGLGLMGQRRRRGRRKVAERNLCSGPAKLCQAMGIDGRFNCHALQAGRLQVLAPPVDRSATGRVSAGPRIGISKARSWPLRFWVADSPWVSRPG